jgi:hypothetical protein
MSPGADKQTGYGPMADQRQCPIVARVSPEPEVSFAEAVIGPGDLSV